MGALPRGLVFGVCAVLLAIGFVNASQAETASSVVVGLAKCSDCTRKNMKAESAFKGLHVAIKCKTSNGEYETKAVGQLDNSGAFSIPLAASLLREDGELKQDCFAQLHSASSTPCPGQEPSKIVQQSKENGKDTFIAVAGKMHYSSAACASAFICDPFHKKHFILHKPIKFPPKSHFLPPIHKPEHKPIPEYKPPTPEYKPPTPVPEYKPPTPVYMPPTPVYTPPKPTPIYHPPVDHKPLTEPQLFKKLLPFIYKKPFPPLFPKFPPIIKKKFPLFPPIKEESKP